MKHTEANVCFNITSTQLESILVDTGLLTLQTNFKTRKATCFVIFINSNNLLLFQ